MEFVEINDILADAKERLTAYGFELADKDETLLKYALDGVHEQITNATNQADIPAGLRYTACDMVMGGFLQMLKAFSPDSLKGFDLSIAVKQITAGDTNTTFAVGEGSSTDEQRLDAVISWFKTHGTGDFAKYRRVCW